MNSEGHINEEVYEHLGFPSYINYFGEEVSRPNNISQKCGTTPRFYSMGFNLNYVEITKTKHFLHQQRNKSSN